MGLGECLGGGGGGLKVPVYVPEAEWNCAKEMTLARRSLPMRQITAYLDESERLALADYARQFGLDGSGIANLLLIRELRVARLLSTKRHKPPSKPLSGRKKVTAHQPDDSVFLAFKEHAALCDLTTSAALASIIRAELDERWLDKVLGEIDSN